MKDLEYGIENMEQMEEIEIDGKRKQRYRTQMEKLN
jgi:hypothetical protein